MEQKDISKDIVHIFPDSLRSRIGNIISRPDITEIRIRCNLPLMIQTLSGEFYVTKEGELSLKEGNTCVVSPDEIKIIFQKISQYSLFAYREEIKEGFITLRGGHRMGLCGKVYFDSDGKRQVKQITSMNLRIARQIYGCAEKIFPYLFSHNEFLHTLLISPPGVGKTTFLRDIIRLISDGTHGFSGQNISVVDERSEIGNRTDTEYGFYLGKRTDLLDHCSKAHGMLMMLRTMNPRVIAVDEIGAKKDIRALQYIRNCGCRILMTAHGQNLQDILSRPVLGKYLKQFPFERYVVFSVGVSGERIAEIYDRNQQLIWKGETMERRFL